MFRRSLSALVALAIAAATAQAQFVISPRAGLIHHLDGEVLVEDQELIQDGAAFGWVGEGKILRTGDTGHCEIVLTPGSVLRIAPNSSILLLSEDITNIRIELLDGSSIIDWRSGPEDQPIRLAHGESQVELHKRGQYRFDAYADKDAQLRVFQGQAELTLEGASVAAQGGQAITLGSGDVEGFDTEETDSFDAWHEERAQFIAEVNSLARTRNQRIAAGFRTLFRHLANGQSRGVRRGPNPLVGSRR
jgi:hypothetical protein